MGAKWEKWKEEFAEEKKKQQEKDRIKAERKAEQRANMSETDKLAKEGMWWLKFWAFMKWGLPGLFIIFVILLFLVTWILNQFGIYLG